MKRFLRLLGWCFATAAIVVAVGGAALYWLYHDARAPGPLSEAHTIVVPAHTRLAGIAALLAENGVIRHPLTFEAMAKLSGRAGALKSGEYEFPAAASTLQAIDILASGKTLKHRLTIPEGLDSADIIALVRDAPALDGDTGPPPPEGELFPDTYVYAYGDSRRELVERMHRDMAHVVAQLWKERRKDLPFATPEQAVVLASIVEKETAREEERPHIAGVYINRLRLGMRLQADPTVLFALAQHDGGKLDRPLIHADLAVDSPYNTYLVKGLPPAPIANPGRASLLAAMRPERTDDLYFVADGDGGHVFAKTLAEQTRNIARYLHGAAPDAEPAPAAASAPEPAPQAESSSAEKPHPTPTHPPPVARPKPAGKQTARVQRACRHEAGRSCPR